MPFVSIFQIVSAHTTIPKKVVIVNSRYWNRKELWVQSLMSDNALTKAVTVWLWRYDKPTLYYYAKSMLTVKKLSVLLEPTVPFGVSCSVFTINWLRLPLGLLTNQSR